MSRKRIPLNQNGCTANFRIGVPFEQNLQFCPDEGVVVGYGNRIRAKYTAKWGVQIAGMIFQTRSRIKQEGGGNVRSKE